MVKLSVCDSMRICLALKHMKAAFSILLLAPFFSMAQLYDKYDIAFINDRDGFTFIRSGQSQGSPVIDTLFNGEFFQFVPTDTSEWWSVYKMWNVSGFVHKSRVKPLTAYARTEQRHLIDSIFRIEKQTYLSQNEGITNHHEEKFSPVLYLFLKYIEVEFDSMLFKQFLDILMVEIGSADELPPTALGYVYILYPDRVLSELRKRNEKNLVDLLEFGFLNVMIDRSDYERLNQKIENLKENFAR
jgi:hypothetical protein